MQPWCQGGRKKSRSPTRYGSGQSANRHNGRIWCKNGREALAAKDPTNEEQPVVCFRVRKLLLGGMRDQEHNPEYNVWSSRGEERLPANGDTRTKIHSKDRCSDGRAKDLALHTAS